MSENENKNLITWSKLALNKAQELAFEKSNQGEPSTFRLYLEGKGCDGFFYGISFDSPSSQDVVFRQEDIELVVDPDTLEFVKDSTIDWYESHEAQGFIVNNPHHAKYRGKFFKRPSWRASQDRLEKEL